MVAGLGTLSMSAGGSTAVGSRPLGPTETSLLEVAVFVVPFLLPIAAAITWGSGSRSRWHGPQIRRGLRAGRPVAGGHDARPPAADPVPRGGSSGGLCCGCPAPGPPREKAIGTLLALGVGVLALLSLSSPVEWLRPLLAMVLTIPTVIYLGLRLRAHTDTMPATGLALWRR